MAEYTFHQGFLLIAGPTASGKSALAIALAQVLHGEVVNADAFQLYDGMDLCTAKPSLEEQAQVPHHLYGVLKGQEKCDAARYVDLVKPVIAEIQSRGKLPILVGGSGLYLKALTHGLSDLPRDEALRQKLADLPLEEKVAQLLHLDPDAPSNVNLQNDRYVTRALEICLLSGQPQSQLRKAWEGQQPAFTGICLEWDRDLLAARIAIRTQRMFEQGLVEEIATTDPDLSLTAGKAIGVREVRDHLAGLMDLEACIEAVTIATRQYAKRQRTWFRRETGFLRLPMSPDEPIETLTQRALALLTDKSLPCEGELGKSEI